MKRSAALLGMFLSAALLLSACGAPGGAPSGGEEATFHLKLAGIKSEDDPATQAMKVFAEEVNANSGGSITVEVYPNSVLGTSNDLLSGMTDGTVEMMYNTLSCYAWMSGAERFNAVSAPFIWQDNDELQAFLDSEACQTWFEEAADTSGVRCLMARGELPPRQLTANRPVASAEDFVGLKIRTAESPLVQETMKRLGAQPVVIALNDLYMALRQGTADAQENNFMTVATSSFYEVQDYFMQTDYIRDVSAIFISDAVWDAMSADQQEVLRAAAEKAVETEETLIAEQMEDVMAVLRENMTEVEVDVASIQDKLGSAVYEEFDAAGELWPTGTIDTILAFKQSYES
ncbi:TRAP transporter substrate-binding protein [Flavonifractor hominis]|uniref:TRAP transporter substrate-binding protein n=1 Tax=Flavonifractor hominis TaxID=3133178 RepID=A0ABV1ERT0_9FIRM